MIETRQLTLRLGQFHLNEVSLRVEEGQYFVLLGPTGAGKTVLVECIAGFHRPQAGSVWLDDSDVTLLKPEERRIGYVPQDYALFPHLTVQENIEFGLRLTKMRPEAQGSRVAELVDLLHISPLLSRLPLTLSGGEKQRVALARALAVRPRVLLLDEPLSAVDEQMRERLCVELRALHDRTGTTIIHVCHNFEETLAVADRVGVIRDGQVQQVGTAEDIFQHPQTEFVAEFTRTENLYRGVLKPMGEGQASFLHDETTLRVKTPLSGKTHLSLRPEHVVVDPPEGSENVLWGHVVALLDKGPLLKVEIEAGLRVVALLPKSVAEARGLSVGRAITVALPPARLHAFQPSHPQGRSGDSR